MRTGRPSCARSGSGRDQGSGPWPAPEGHRPGQADRTSGPTAHGYPWGRADARRARARDVAGNPGTPLTITSGSCSIFMDYSFIAPKFTRPGHESRVRPANVVWYRYRLVSGARAGRNRSRRLPAPLRSVAGHRSALGWTGPFVRRAVAPRADRLPATATRFRLEEPPARPGSPGLDLRSVPYLPSLLRRTRLRPVLLAVGERRLGRAKDAKAPYKRANGHERPGDEARKASSEQRHPEQGAARRCSDGVLVRLQRGSALLDEGRHHPRDGGSRPRAAADDASAHTAVAGVHAAVGPDPLALS